MIHSLRGNIIWRPIRSMLGKGVLFISEVARRARKTEISLDLLDVLLDNP